MVLRVVIHLLILYILFPLRDYKLDAKLSIWVSLMLCSSPYLFIHVRIIVLQMILYMLRSVNCFLIIWIIVASIFMSVWQEVFTMYDFARFYLISGSLICSFLATICSLFLFIWLHDFVCFLSSSLIDSLLA